VSNKYKTVSFRITPELHKYIQLTKIDRDLKDYNHVFELMRKALESVQEERG
jgi:hypothetical protein